MNNSNTKVTQKEFDVVTLFLSKQADHEIEIKENDVEGVIYITIDSEDDWFGFNFKARITKSYTVGELWKDEFGVHCIDAPSVEIDDIRNITVSYNDSSVGDNETLDIDYTTRIDDINKLVSDFIYTQELTVESKYNVYNTYNV